MSDQPTSGGSYIRQKSGELKLVARTEEAAPAEAGADTNAAGSETDSQAKKKDA